MFIYASVIRWPEVATLAWWCWWPPGAICTLYLWCAEKYCLSWTRSPLDFTEWSVQFHPLLAYYPLKLLVPHKSSLFFVAWLRGAASHPSEVAKARSTCHDVEYLGQPVISLTSWLLPSMGSLKFLFLVNPFPNSWTNTSIFHAENTLKGNLRTGTPQRCSSNHDPVDPCGKLLSWNVVTKSSTCPARTARSGPANGMVGWSALSAAFSICRTSLFSFLSAQVVGLNLRTSGKAMSKEC